jgi:uncharacterized membrane protein (DUF373 family)
MESMYARFEKYISYIMMGLAMLYVCFQVLDLVYHFSSKLVHGFQIGSFAFEEKGRPVAGLFFNILLLLEIIQTIKVFATDHAVKVRIIMIVGLIAVTRRILMLDLDEVDPMSEFAVAALIISLAAGYYLVTRSEKFTKTD